MGMKISKIYIDQQETYMLLYEYKVTYRFLLGLGFYTLTAVRQSISVYSKRISKEFEYL